MEFKDYYAVLGIKKDAPQDEIKRAYRKLARKHHPDLNPGNQTAEHRLKEINEAQEVIGDPEKRRKYDELGTNWRMYEQSGADGASPFPGGSPFGRPGSGRRGGFQNMSPDQANKIFGGSGDFFETFFSGDGVRQPVARKGRDREQQITLTLEEVFDGATRDLNLTTSGQARRIDVKIPSGVSDNSRVRVAGEGEPGAHGGPAGDLFLRVHQAPHGTFTRQGQDLRVTVGIPVTTAVLGGLVPVPRLRGTPLTLKIPAATQSGQVFRLKGQGLPAVGMTRTGGDLYATMAILVPERLTTSQREHYEALTALETEAAKAPTIGGELGDEESQPLHRSGEGGSTRNTGTDPAEPHP
jgi:curved DNA-binding protein